jgi:hypothetical protein
VKKVLKFFVWWFAGGVAILVIIAIATSSGSSSSSTSTTVVPETQQQTTSSHTSTPVAPKHYSGNGGENLGTVTVSSSATLKWTNDGGLFSIITSESVPVNSQASSGSSVLEAGTYREFQVNAVGNWTITIE